MNWMGITFLLILTLQFWCHSMAQCPTVFEENTEVAALSYYCTVYSYSVARIPVHLHEDICYSKCLIHEKCLYFHYDVTITHCVMCLQNDVTEHVVNLQTGSELEPFPVTSFPPEVVVHSRIDTCAILTDNCATSRFGGGGGQYNYDVIPMDTTISSIQFCSLASNARWRHYLGGFNITLSNGHSIARGRCMLYNLGVHEPRYDLASDEVITSIIVHYDQYIVGVSMRTNLSGVGGTALGPEFLSPGLGMGQMCIVRGHGLAAIESWAGSIVDGIRFRFREC